MGVLEREDVLRSRDLSGVPDADTIKTREKKTASDGKRVRLHFTSSRSLRQYHFKRDAPLIGRCFSFPFPDFLFLALLPISRPRQRRWMERVS